MEQTKKTPWAFTAVFLFYILLVFLDSGFILPLTLIPELVPQLPPVVGTGIIFVTVIVSLAIMTLMLKKGHISLSVFLPVIIITCVASLCFLSLYMMSSTTPFAWINKNVSHALDQVSSMFDKMMKPQDLMNFKLQRPIVERTIVSMFPSLMISETAFIMWINAVVISKVMGIKLNTWKMPDLAVGVFIIAAVMSLIPDANIRMAGLNFLLLVGVAYFFQGLSIISYLMEALKWHSILRWIIYILILSQFYIMLVVSLFGLFDTWFYFRNKIRKTKGDNKNESSTFRDS